jgi:hypothetical protein
MKTAAALAALLLICGSAAGLYFFEPDIFGATGANTIAEPTDVTEAPARIDPAAPANIESTTAAEIPETSGSSETDKTKPPASTAKSSVAAKGTGAEPKAEPDVDMGDIRVNGETVYIGNVKIDEKGIVPNTYVDENGVKRPIPPTPGAVPFPGLTREQLRALTPQQRRKLLNARRRLLQLQNQRPPISHPDPQQP